MTIELGTQVTQRLRRRRDWPHWFFICERLHAAVVNFYAKDSGDISSRTPDERLVQDKVALHEATAIGSKVQSDYLRDQHQIMFDIDVPHVYVPSTQEGHGHLIFRKQVPFGKYLGLLEHMADMGLIEQGFVDAARNRGEAWLRTPWTAKGEAGNVAEISDGHGGVKGFVPLSELGNKHE
jgi:hypothetical protein